jgi:hypothetical protein
MKDFFQLREAVKSADKKPENYTDPATGKTKTRMVPTMREQAEQVTVGDYTTKHFDICPSAVKLYSNISGKTEMTHLIVETMMLQDLLFRLEKQLIAQGSADEEDVEKAEHYGEMIMDNAEQMDLYDEHSYIEDVHLAKIRQLAGEEDDGDEDEEMNETKAAPKGFHFTKDGKLKRGDADQDGPGGRMLRADPLDKQRSKVPPVSEKTLTPAEKKKREEIAKAMERENPGMDMSKKMAIATATAKRVAEEVELDEISQELANRVAKKRQDQALDLRQKAVDEPDMSKSFAHSRAANKASHKAGQTYTRMSRKSLKDIMRKEEVELEEKAYVSSLSPELGRKGSHDVIGKDGKVVKSYPYTKDGMKAAQAHLSKMKEEVELDEAFKVGDKVTYQKSKRERGNAVISSVSATKKNHFYLKTEKEGTIMVPGGELELAESVELNELSPKTLGSYIKKASADQYFKGQDAQYHDNKAKNAEGPFAKETKKKHYVLAARANDKASNRDTGITRAVNRLTKEEVELDEVSDKMKQRYINKSMSDYTHSNAVRKDAEATGKTDLAAKMKARMKKRNQGMSRAFGGERD